MVETPKKIQSTTLSRGPCKYFRENLNARRERRNFSMFSIRFVQYRYPKYYREELKAKYARDNEIYKTGM